MLPDDPAALALLRTAELGIEGRIVEASNATLLCALQCNGTTVGQCVYKPVRGERPLWDFPSGTLAGREVSSYLVSEATGWGLVPPTILRDGPLGPGMVQLWIDIDEDRDLVDVVGPDEVPDGWRRVLRAHDRFGDPALLIHADVVELRRMAVLDVLINNADRKGGHVLPGLHGGVYGVDHGVCMHQEDKLRTVLWGFMGEPLSSEIIAVLEKVRAALDGDLGESLHEHLTRREVRAVCSRADRLLDTETFPGPEGGWPSVPWPAF